MPYFQELETLKFKHTENITRALFAFAREVRASKLPGTYKGMSIRQALRLASKMPLRSDYLHAGFKPSQLKGPKV